MSDRSLTPNGGPGDTDELDERTAYVSSAITLLHERIGHPSMSR